MNRKLSASSASDAGDRLRERLRQQHIRVAKVARQDVEAMQGSLPTLTVVDGARGAREEAVRPRGMIVYLFDATRRAALFTLSALRERAPRDTGAFESSFTVLVDGIEASMDNLPPGQEVVIVNRQPYSRRLEQGWSLQAPSGVFEVTARSVRRQWPAIQVNFSYVPLRGAGLKKGKQASRYPALFLSSKAI